MKYLDLENKRYRTSFYVFGFEVPTSWKPLPEIEYISVFKATVKSALFSRTGERNSFSKEIQVNLVYNKREIITAQTFDDKEGAIPLAREIASQLDGVNILDATQKLFVWLD